MQVIQGKKNEKKSPHLLISYTNRRIATHLSTTTTTTVQVLIEQQRRQRSKQHSLPMLDLQLPAQHRLLEIPAMAEPRLARVQPARERHFLVLVRAVQIGEGSGVCVDQCVQLAVHAGDGVLETALLAVAEDFDARAVELVHRGVGVVFLGELGFVLGGEFAGSGFC